MTTLLETLKQLQAGRTKGEPWEYNEVKGVLYGFDASMRCECWMSSKDGEFLAAMANNAEKLLVLVESAQAFFTANSQGELRFYTGELRNALAPFVKEPK